MELNKGKYIFIKVNLVLALEGFNCICFKFWIKYKMFSIVFLVSILIVGS